jgi:hypothetical protein
MHNSSQGTIVEGYVASRELSASSVVFAAVMKRIEESRTVAQRDKTIQKT